MFGPWLKTPELQYLSPVDRRHWWDLAQEQSRLTRSWVFWIFVLLMLAGLVVISFFHRVLREAVGGWSVLVYGLYTLVVTRLYQRLFTRRIRLAIRDRLDISYAGRLFPCCIDCGYSLDGFTESTQACPECGNTHIRGNPTPAVVRRYKFGF